MSDVIKSYKFVPERDLSRYEFYWFRLFTGTTPPPLSSATAMAIAMRIRNGPPLCSRECVTSTSTDLPCRLRSSAQYHAQRYAERNLGMRATEEGGGGSWSSCSADFEIVRSEWHPSCDTHPTRLRGVFGTRVKIDLRISEIRALQRPCSFLRVLHDGHLKCMKPC